MLYYFRVGQLYTRRDIYKMIGVDEHTKGGNWDTGYNQYKGDWFIFCNIGMPGRTGHDYQNILSDNTLIWYGKTIARLHHPTIQSMIDVNQRVYIFAREDNSQPFLYLGIGKAFAVEASIPVKVIWTFSDAHEIRPNRLAEEVTEAQKYVEGATIQVSVNRYERNLVARQKCLAHYGYMCVVCAFNFTQFYGEIGKEYMHVHHLTPLAEIGTAYEVNPIQDLRPVCPNCHAMLHRRDPAYTIEELQRIIHQK
jgi:5-methylcytosine-specific restriction enzyme A